MTFRPITEVLREIVNKHNRREDIVNVYIVVDDPKAEEPMTKQVALTEEMLAREESETLAQTILGNQLVNSFLKWRAEQ